MNKEIDYKKVLVFDIWSDYAHFRRSYTTTSPLTYSIPPRTALTGLIAAIIGGWNNKEEYLIHFTKNKADISLKIQETNPIQKVRIAENLINTKTAKGIGMNLIKSHTQIDFEFIKNPKYRIYFHHQNEELHKKLKYNLQDHKSVYTPYLGLSEHIANFEYIDEFPAKFKKNNVIQEIDSVIPKNIINNQNIIFDNEREYFSVLLPTEMDQNRVITEFEDVLFERNGKKLKAEVNHYWELKNDDRIIFL